MIESTQDSPMLPADGTYPPRILVPTGSIWLHDGDKTIAPGLVVQIRDGKCYLSDVDSHETTFLMGKLWSTSACCVMVTSSTAKRFVLSFREIP
ncbi:MAG: hypothetical protein JNJ61_18480 [Anaerolineae bacterium]|nr:hypothetical protein [Anaerolineae bacterium]